MQPLLISAIFVICACAANPGPTRRVLSTPGAVQLPSCFTAHPSRPNEAVQQQIYGSVLVGYVIEPDGRVTDITLEDPKASPLLFAAVRDWLYDCRVAGGVGAPKHIVELFTFPPWDGPPPKEPVTALEADSVGITPPRKDERCQPDRPPPALLVRGKMTIEYEVHSNGQVGEVSLQRSEVPEGLIRTVSLWLRSCPFEPAKRDGKPLAVRLRQTLSFDFN